MGAHDSHKLHRRIAAIKQRRLPPDVEASSVNELVARFSPTFNWASALSTDEAATATTADPAAATTAAATPSDPAAAAATSATTSNINIIAPLTTSDTAQTTDPAAPTDTATTDTSDAATTDPNAIPTTTTSSSIVAPVTTTSAVVPTLATTTAAITTLPATTPLTSLVLTTIASSSTSAAPSATQSSSDGSGTDVGGIVGGLAGALLGIAALFYVVRFLLDRRRERNDEYGAAAFNANDFRRSAVLMEDPPTHDETVERGFNPRPPTMIERRLASPAPTFGTQYGAPGPAIGPTDYEYNQYQAYGPAQMRSPLSADPMLAYPEAAYTSAYGQSPFSPIATSPNQYEGNQQAGVLTRQPSNPTTLSRAPSANGPSGYPSEDPHFGGYPSPQRAQYVDLDRSSVTPYQAAQYAEISEHLHTEVPAGLDTPAVNSSIQNGNKAEPSPFSDPMPEHLPYPGDAGSDTIPRPSTDSVAHDLDDFPAPPSPTNSGRSRIVDSLPPMLPEIDVESRPESYNLANEFSSGTGKEYLKSPLGNQFPTTPSPLASSFGVPTPPAGATSFPEHAAEVEAPPTPRANKSQTPAARPETVYDDDDAYGGF
ncbi:hypothetical protein H0H92_003683 [Tricholoma furcatifolium]|nr:hypothetical protein H0H92_003683 [Tricholoma furcatifolium]